MKVLFISKYAGSHYFGKASRQFLYSKALTDRGHEVMLVFSRSNNVVSNPSFKNLSISHTEGRLTDVMLNGPLTSAGLNLKRLWSWLWFEIQLFRFYKSIIAYKPNVIIVSSLSILTFIFGVFVQKRLKIPLVIEVRDLYPLTLIEIGGMSKSNPFVWLIGQIERFGYKNADLMISSLENTQLHFETTAGKKISFKWLPIGFDNSMYDEFPNETTIQFIERLNVLKSSGKFIVGYSGSFGTANALDELAKISNEKDIQTNDIYFVFIGSGPLLHYLKSVCSEQNTYFTGHVPKEQLPFYLQQCDILINTWLNRPIYRFGVSPNKWIDYMFSARPVLLALNANSQIFSEAGCGWQIPAQDTVKLKEYIIQAKNTPTSDLNDLGQKGKHYLISNLTYTSLSGELEDALLKLL